MLQFICGFALGFSLVAIFVCFVAIKCFLPTPPFCLGTQSSPTESSDYKEFYEEDKKNTQDFYKTLQNLNEFMTGQDFEEDINNVRSQED